MKSIRNHLVRTLSYTITGAVFLILLAIDIAVDRWIDRQFNQSLTAKAEMLITLVREVNSEVGFHSASEFLTAFDGSSEPEYFQLWLGDTVIERSESLSLFSAGDLPVIEPSTEARKIIKAPLPDGRDGRIVYIRFVPQYDNNPIPNEEGKVASDQQTALLAYAISAEGINFILTLIDVVFVITALGVIVFIRSFVRKSVESGLSPLNKLNEQIKRLSLAEESSLIHLAEPIEELLPIKESLNRFIDENRKLYLREKRLASDISHELKTPIAELISLTEVVQKFPEDKNLKNNFAPEVFRISKRLKDIVSNILLLHKYQHAKLETNDVFDINQVIETLLAPLKDAKIVFVPDNNLPPVVSNLFAIETILSNLIGNAVVHGMPGTPITITTMPVDPDRIMVQVSNVPAVTLTAEDLNQFFDPLWQKDPSRTSAETYGLGLPIAAAFSNAISAGLETSLKEQEIIFSLTINVGTAD